MNTQQILEIAIQEKKQVSATYKGLRREMCPHALGFKKGKLHCLFYQFGGDSSSGIIVPGSPNNWRCIDVTGLSDVVTQIGPWHTANNHSRGNHCIDTLLIEV